MQNASHSMSVYMGKHHRLPQNKSQLLQSLLHPTRTTVHLECPPNPTLVLHTLIMVSAGKVVVEDGDTPLIWHTSRSTLQIFNAVNKLQPQPCNKQPLRPALGMRNLPLCHPDPKNVLIHAR